MTPIHGGDRLKPKVSLSKIDLGKLKWFVLDREVENGFSFCKPIPASLSDTYYALYILKTIGEEIRIKSELLEFLENNLRNETYSIFYVFNCLKLLNRNLPDKSVFIQNRIYEVLDKIRKGKFAGQVGGSRGSKRLAFTTYSFELPSLLRELYMLISSLKLLNIKVDSKNLDLYKSYLEKIKPSNLKDVFYHVSILESVKGSIDGAAMISFVLSHECREGGFSKSPGGFPPYLEDTYFAVRSLDILNYPYRREKTISLISFLQNPDGGFRRSIHGGISTLEYTFYAVSCLKYMGVLDDFG